MKIIHSSIHSFVRVLNLTSLIFLIGCSQSSNSPNIPTEEVQDRIIDISKLSLGSLEIDVVDTLNMGITTTSSRSLEKQITIVNNSESTVELNIDSLTNGFGFKLNRCPDELESNQRCSIKIYFSARGLFDGLHSSNLLFSSGINSVSIPLEATISEQPNPDSTGVPEILITMTENFTVNGLPYKRVNLENIGTGTAKNIQPIVSTDYRLYLNRCPSSLKPSEKCYYLILFNNHRNSSPSAGNVIIQMDGGLDDLSYSKRIDLLTSVVSEQIMSIDIIQPLHGSIIGDSSVSYGTQAEYTFVDSSLPSGTLYSWANDCLGQIGNSCILSNIISNKNVSIDLFCDAGYKMDGSCQACGAGEYQNQQGQNSCLSCTNKKPNASSVIYGMSSALTNNECPISLVSSCVSGYLPSSDNQSCVNVSIQNFGSYRAYSNGTFAPNCNSYRNSLYYVGATGSGIYRIKPGATTLDVYCDQEIDGGGWMLVARSVVGGSGSNFGWKNSVGSVSNDSSIYSLNFNSTGLSFTQMIFGNYSSGKTWGNYVYKHGGANWDIIKTYTTSAIFLGTPTPIKGGNSQSTMFNWVGFVNDNTKFSFRDGDPAATYGLRPNGWRLYYPSESGGANPQYGGYIDGSQGMIMVR